MAFIVSFCCLVSRSYLENHSLKKLLYIVPMVALVAGLIFATKMEQQSAPSASNNGLAPDFQGKVYQPARPLSEFELVNQTGQKVNNQSLADQWTLIFLGYTSCPDVCPATLAKLTNLQPKLQKLTETQVQVLFVSVDPQRDTSAKLKQYVEYFNPAFWAATAPHKTLFPFVRSVGLMYAMVEDTTKENYAVDHASSIVLINPKGDIQAIFKPKFQEVGQLSLVDNNLILSDFEKLINL